MMETPMLDLHDGQVRPFLRALLECEADTIACACPTRPSVEAWLGSRHPILSVNAVGLKGQGEPPSLTRTSLVTLTGPNALELYEAGSVRVGRWTVRLVADWPPGARYDAGAVWP